MEANPRIATVPPKASTIIAGGVHYPCEAKVLTWLDHGKRFVPGMGHNKQRLREINLGLLHWTGAENHPTVMFNNLVKSKLGIEFAIADDGIVYQFADPLECDTADAGKVNDRSFGVEVQCRGFYSPLMIKNRRRERYTATIHGKPCKLVDFFPKQYASIRALFDTMLIVCPSMIARVPKNRDGSVDTSFLGPIEYKRWSGVACHSNVSPDKKKFDAGPRVLEFLDHHFSTRITNPTTGLIV